MEDDPKAKKFYHLDPATYVVKTGPDLDQARSQDEYEEMVIANAKYFTVMEIRPGAWRRNEPNLIRTEHPTYEEALIEAKRRYEIQGSPKRGNLIYAVADFPKSGAMNMSALVEGYPPIAGPYTRQAHMEKLKGKKQKAPKIIVPPVGNSDRYFEGEAYKRTMVSNIVKPGGNKQAIKYKNRRSK